MQIIYTFPDIALKDYQLIFLPGPNNPLSPYKKFSQTLEKQKSPLKKKSLRVLNKIKLTPDQLNKAIIEFIDLYSSIFTDPDEREDTQGMINRVTGLEKVTGQTIFFICVKQTTREVIGGLIFELHQNSVCLLLTYIFTKPSERSRGLGQALIKTVVPFMISNLINNKIRAVLLETENPNFTPRSNKSEITANEDLTLSKRLDFFRKVGAKLLDISYTQPKLSIEPKDFANRVYHLYFLILPDAIEDHESIADKEIILHFLLNFYNILEYSGQPASTRENLTSNYNNQQINYPIRDIDLYRTYIQIELLSLLYKCNNTRDSPDKIIYINELIINLKNQFQFIASEVRKVKEYTSQMALKNYSEDFVKELTHLLIEKVTGLNDNPVITDSSIKNEYQKYVINNLSYENYGKLYLFYGTEKNSNLPENKIKTFYSLTYIEKKLIELQKTCSSIHSIPTSYKALISDIP